MSLSGKRKTANNVAGPSNPASSRTKRVRIDETNTLTDTNETDFFDGDPELDQFNAPRSRRQRKGRITGQDMGAESSDEEDDGDANTDAAAAQKPTLDEDEDMFDVQGSNEDDDDATTGKGKTKMHSNQGQTRFLSLGELDVGQDFDSTKRTALDDTNVDPVTLSDDGDELDPELELEDTDSGTDNDEDDGAHDLNAEGERTPPITSPGGTPLSPTTPHSRSRSSKRKMGPKITGFNMKEEMKSGNFDQDGNYHEKERDPQAQHDTWLAGVYSKSKIREARLAHEKRQREAQQKERLAQQQDGDEDEIRKQLTQHMMRGETVVRTLQRLGQQAAKLRKSKAPSHRTPAAETSDRGRDSDAKDLTRTTKEVETVTHLTSVLMSRFGQLDVYEETYESLLQAVRKSGLVRQTFDPAARFDQPDLAVDGSTVAPTAPSIGASAESDRASTTKVAAEGLADQWEYKWSASYLAASARESGTSVAPEIEVFGPFSQADLISWAQDGYFGAQGERILLRRAASKDPWLPYPQLF